MPDIEDHIQRAIGEGKFENLPGKGKPLKLEKNPHADPEWELAYHMLQSSGYTLPWIELRKQIETEIEDARRKLASNWNLCSEGTDHLVIEHRSEWKRAEQAFLEQVKRINELIHEHNHQTPSDRFHLNLLDADREIKKVR